MKQSVVRVDIPEVLFIQSVFISTVTVTKSNFKIYSKVCCGGNLYYKHIWKCEKTKNGEIAVKLKWKEKKKYWTKEYIGKHFFQSTARVSASEFEIFEMNDMDTLK